MMITTSRWISVTLLGVFILKLWFQLRTHSTLFHLTDQKDAEPDDNDEDARRPRSKLMASTMAFELVFLAFSICAYALVRALSHLDVSSPDYSAAPSKAQVFISLTFFAVLPIILEIPGGLRIVRLANDNRMDLVRTLE